ncbi:MAG: hypothetical protein LQ342_002775 [Letrouitia transgressa]|nr:MAG: hypothetical protein LQ342_002775 [Letrouitia transgressa]
MNVTNDKFQYLAVVEVGTPPQELALVIDTGSADTWLPSIDSNICTENREACLKFGQYDISNSSTAKDLQKSFNTSHSDQSGYIGSFITDNLSIGGVAMENVQLGLATRGEGLIPISDGARVNGVLGLAFETAENAVITNGSTPYPTIISELKAQGLIHTQSLSMWLNTADSSDGSILFGGIDNAKSKGPLISLPMTWPRNPAKVFSIQFTSLSASNGGPPVTLTSNTTILPAILDSGASAAMVPSFLAEAVFRYFGAVTDDPRLTQAGMGNGGVVPCNLSTSAGTFEFGFGGPNGPKISLAASELVMPWANNLTFGDYSPACLLGIRGWDSSHLLLGDSFLRSAYAVFNLETRQVALAQANTDPVTSSQADVQEILPGSNGIPSVDHHVPALPWPAILVDAYKEKDNATVPARTNASAPAVPSKKAPVPSVGMGTAMPSVTQAIHVTNLPNRPSFTALGPANLGTAGVYPAITVKPASPTSSGQGTKVPPKPVKTKDQEIKGAASSEMKVTGAVLALGITMGMAAMVMEVLWN